MRCSCAGRWCSRRASRSTGCRRWRRRAAASFAIDSAYQEGDWVGAGEPLMYISGSLEHLVDLETVFLQKLGPPCVAAFNAFLMCTDLP